MAVIYRDDLFGVDWRQLKLLHTADRFDNGRTADQLRQSFSNSRHVCIAWQDRRVVATVRVLSDDVWNAYLVDLWTWSPLRGRGIASTMIQRLTSRLSGQHLILQTDVELVPFYERRGFSAQPTAMGQIIGRLLAKNEPESESPLRSINANEGGVPTRP
jgi:hypothetical protein